MQGTRAGRIAVVACAVTWLVATLAIDVATGPSMRLGALYAIAPLIVCAVLPAAGTAVFAGVAIALAVASGWWNNGTTPQLTAVRLIDVVLVSAAGVAVAAVRVRREAQHARVLAIAEVAQRAILPLLPARVRWVATAARYVAADEDTLIGGDFYDCYSADSLTRFVIGDVRGKGVGAVGQAARVIRAFRQAAASEPTLPEVAAAMSRYLAGFANADGEDFTTALLVEMTSPTHVTVVACGHPPPLLVNATSGVHPLPDVPAGLPLGLGSRFTPATIPWGSGNRLLLFTDGLVEARDAAGGFFPLTQLALPLAIGSVDTALDTLLATVRRHVPHGRLGDDLAVVLLEHTGIDTAPDTVAATPILEDIVVPDPRQRLTVSLDAHRVSTAAEGERSRYVGAVVQGSCHLLRRRGDLRGLRR